MTPYAGRFPTRNRHLISRSATCSSFQNADLYLIAPASANTVAKLATGLADNLLTSCALAATCPVVVAPAMNNHMYEHPANQSNIELLRTRGVHVIEPDSGRLASRGEHGIGRLATPERLLATCEDILAKGYPDGLAGADIPLAGPTGSREWAGLRVLVTAGGTREPIDSVRFLGNSSSGRMGLALADAALRRGAEVTLVAANVALEPSPGIVVRRVSTAAELQEACEREFPDCDILLMAAAVADFRPADRVEGKIKKGGREHLTLELEPTTDVLRELSSKRKPGQTLVGFAAEHGPEGLEQARAKLAAKHLDTVVLNDISRSDIGFESPVNEVTILTQEKNELIPRAPKETIAEAILDVIARGSRQSLSLLASARDQRLNRASTRG